MQLSAGMETINKPFVCIVFWLKSRIKTQLVLFCTSVKISGHSEEAMTQSRCRHSRDLLQIHLSPHSPHFSHNLDGFDQDRGRCHSIRGQ